MLNCSRLLLSVTIALTATSLQAAVISSTFDTDTDGWTKLPGSAASSSVDWESSGGNPDGFLRYSEAGTGYIDYVAAPAKFLGDKSAYYGETLSFDIMSNNLSSATNYDDQVRLIGGGITLRFQLPNPSPLNTWHSRSMLLTETAGWINDASGLAPTFAEMLTVLGDITDLHLLIDYRSGAEQISYDNVVLTPEPASLAMLAVGGLALRARRRA